MRIVQGNLGNSITTARSMQRGNDAPNLDEQSTSSNWEDDTTHRTPKRGGPKCQRTLAPEPMPDDSQNGPEDHAAAGSDQETLAYEQLPIRLALRDEYGGDHEGYARGAHSLLDLPQGNRKSDQPKKQKCVFEVAHIAQSPRHQCGEEEHRVLSKCQSRVPQRPHPLLVTWVDPIQALQTRLGISPRLSQHEIKHSHLRRSLLRDEH